MRCYVSAHLVDTHVLPYRISASMPVETLEKARQSILLRQERAKMRLDGLDMLSRLISFAPSADELVLLLSSTGPALRSCGAYQAPSFVSHGISTLFP